MIARPMSRRGPPPPPTRGGRVTRDRPIVSGSLPPLSSLGQGPRRAPRSVSVISSFFLVPSAFARRRYCAFAAAAKRMTNHQNPKRLRAIARKPQQRTASAREADFTVRRLWETVYSSYKVNSATVNESGKEKYLMDVDRRVCSVGLFAFFMTMTLQRYRDDGRLLLTTAGRVNIYIYIYIYMIIIETCVCRTSQKSS